jgi:hypothetical protein
LERCVDELKAAAESKNIKAAVMMRKHILRVKNRIAEKLVAENNKNQDG